MTYTKKELKEIKKHDQKKWQFNGKLKTAVILILAFAGIGMIGSALMFFLGMFGIVLDATSAETSLKLNLVSGIILTFVGSWIFVFTAVSMTMGAFILSNKNTNAKMLLAIFSVMSFVCLLGGILLLTTPPVDEKEIEAIEMVSEIRDIEEEVEKTIAKEQIDDKLVQEQRMYEAKYDKAVEFLMQIENNEIEEEKLVDKFSNDFKIIFLQAKKDLILEGKIKDKSEAAALEASRNATIEANMMVVNKDVDDLVENPIETNNADDSAAWIDDDLDEEVTSNDLVEEKEFDNEQN